MPTQHVNIGKSTVVPNDVGFLWSEQRRVVRSPCHYVGPVDLNVLSVVVYNREHITIDHLQFHTSIRWRCTALRFVRWSLRFATTVTLIITKTTRDKQASEALLTGVYSLGYFSPGAQREAASFEAESGLWHCNRIRYRQRRTCRRSDAHQGSLTAGRQCAVFESPSAFNNNATHIRFLFATCSTFAFA